MNQKRSSTSSNSPQKRGSLFTGGVSWLSGISLLSTGMVIGPTPAAPGAPSTNPEDFLQVNQQSLSSAQTAPSAQAAQVQAVTAPVQTGIVPEAAPVVEFSTAPSAPAASSSNLSAPASSQPISAQVTTGNQQASSVPANVATSHVTRPALTPASAVATDNEPRAEVRIASSLQSPSIHVVAQAQPPVATPKDSNISPAGSAIDLIVPTEPAATTDSLSPDALVSPNLEQDAADAFGNNSEYIDPTPYDLGATQGSGPDVILSERSTGCEAILAAGQTAPNSICSPAVTAEAGWAGDSGYQPGNYSPSSLSVVGLQPSAASARDFYNLTVRPPARLTNGNVSLLFPLSIPAAITSAFGWRMHPIAGESRFHSGTDIGAPQGTPVLAAFDGKVDVADFVGGYGLTVVLQHNKGNEQTLYAHLSEIFVNPGDNVKQGEVIGRVGSTGLSTGPHLHFEFRRLTQEGWVVMDAGGVLEQSLAQLVNGLTVGQANPKLQLPAVFQYPGKALRVAETKIDGQTQASQPTQASPDNSGNSSDSSN
ncbi:MAG: hypothetical protein Kow00121_11300 [Elainellaceae cyanobacterium]